MDASVPCCSAQRSRVNLLVRPGLSHFRFSIFDFRFLLALGVTCLALLAQADNPQPATDNPLPIEGLTGFIVGLVTQYPWLATVLLVIGSLRLLLKPIMLAIEWYTKQTPNPNDDVAVLKFEAGPIYKVLSIGLDVLGSIKLPAIKPPAKKT